MDIYNNYVNYLMANYPDEPDTDGIEYDYTDNNEQIGGATGKSNSDLDKPKGGFPPIYFCKKEDKINNTKKEEPVKREFEPNTSNVSIKDILEKRKNITPFVTL